MDEDSLKLLLARGLSVEQIAKRFDRDPSTVSYWMRKYELEAPNRDKYAAKGGIDREALQAFVEDGKSIGQIAVAVGLSKGTVSHWLRKHGLTTRGRAHTATATATAREAGLLAISRDCAAHGVTEFVLEGRGCDRCKRCRQERVAQHRRGLKQTLVDEAGGGCAICGYDRYLGALHFHHVDPVQKRIEINSSGATPSLAALRLEAAKCVVLCSNCRAEVETGIASIPEASLPIN
jgi:transposase